MPSTTCLEFGHHLVAAEYIIDNSKLIYEPSLGYDSKKSSTVDTLYTAEPAELQRVPSHYY